MTDESRRENALAELTKGRRALAAADALIGLGFYDDAASRLYYAGFHACSAALLALGIEIKSHSGLASEFARHLVKPGTIPPWSSRTLAALLGLRQQADYNRYFEMDEEGARDERDGAQRLVQTVESFLRQRGILSDEP
jgi:uncharacterized protein (UPF0332 family)